MKIDYVSDIHINFYVHFKHNQLKWEKDTREWTRELLTTKEGEVLILAGDFSEWNVQTAWFIDECSKYYEKVYYTVGNHDYYIISKNQRKKYGNSIGRIDELRNLTEGLSNVTFLDGVVEEYKGVTFAGHPLWYRIRNDAEHFWYTENSNDSRYIYYQQGYKRSFELLYEESMVFYNSLEDVSIDVFVSHVPPVDPPFSNYPNNACYVAPVPFLVGNHWVCGHQHVCGEFELHGTQFHMNPLGYPGERTLGKIQSFKI